VNLVGVRTEGINRSARQASTRSFAFLGKTACGDLKIEIYWPPDSLNRCRRGQGVQTRRSDRPPSLGGLQMLAEQAFGVAVQDVVPGFVGNRRKQHGPGVIVLLVPRKVTAEDDFYCEDCKGDRRIEPARILERRLSLKSSSSMEPCPLNDAQLTHAQTVQS
jgi:hypothetical protein